MKKFKKFAALIVALTLILALAVIPASATLENNVIAENSEIVASDEHVCNIAKANATRHIVDCDVCGAYERVNHDELEATPKNGFFHSYECVCGYATTAAHEFDTSFDQNGHKKVCVDCGYHAPAESHVLVSYFDSNYHYIECEDCNYVAEQHVGVNWEHVDEYTCEATCSDCGTSELVEHDWNGFICSNCSYELNGLTGAIVGDIREREDGTYRVRFERNENRHYVTLDEVTFEEGDYVVVDHYGNVIFNVTVMVEHEVCDYPEHLPVYVAESVLCTMEYEGYDSNTVTGIAYNDDIVMIVLADNSILCVNDNVVVYDFVSGDVVDIDFICEGERIIWFFVGEQFVILDYYY
jgi:hypothetical protein